LVFGLMKCLTGSVIFLI